MHFVYLSVRKIILYGNASQDRLKIKPDKKSSEKIGRGFLFGNLKDKILVPVLSPQFSVFSPQSLDSTSTQYQLAENKGWRWTVYGLRF
ncbi:MAG: hypothetical protein DWQ02_15145 [Bacteroidetes bacterium]|nr:MAG: hypothetical protein DWQ02_15145 [Bacteroidota bacterium]